MGSAMTSQTLEADTVIAASISETTRKATVSARDCSLRLSPRSRALMRCLSVGVSADRARDTHGSANACVASSIAAGESPPAAAAPLSRPARE